MLYAEIQDDHQKCPEKGALEEWPLDSTDTLGVKNFTEICLCHTFPDKCAFACYAGFKMAAKNDWKMILVIVFTLLCEYSWSQKF